VSKELGHDRHIVSLLTDYMMFSKDTGSGGVSGAGRGASGCVQARGCGGGAGQWDGAG